MKTQSNWEEMFDEQFGDNDIWWRECIAEMRIGDPDFKRLKAFIRSELTSLARDLVGVIEEKKINLSHMERVDKKTGEVEYKGGRQCRSCYRRRDLEETSYNTALSDTRTGQEKLIKERGILLKHNE